MVNFEYKEKANLLLMHKQNVQSALNKHLIKPEPNALIML